MLVYFLILFFKQPHAFTSMNKDSLCLLREDLLSEVKVGFGFVVPNPLLKAFTVCPCQEKTNKQTNKCKGKKTERERRGG